jgi:hypothetical protein
MRTAPVRVFVLILFPILCLVCSVWAGPYSVVGRASFGGYLWSGGI